MPRSVAALRAKMRLAPKDLEMSELNNAVPAIAKALSKRGYETLTPVQQAMLNPDLANADALVSAKTGSGKTVAFGMAMASTLLPEGMERFAPRRRWRSSSHRPASLPCR